MLYVGRMNEDDLREKFEIVSDTDRRLKSSESIVAYLESQRNLHEEDKELENRTLRDINRISVFKINDVLKPIKDDQHIHETLTWFKSHIPESIKSNQLYMNLLNLLLNQELRSCPRFIIIFDKKGEICSTPPRDMPEETFLTIADSSIKSVYNGFLYIYNMSIL